ncbi:phage minor head protein [Roseibium porphyridii]|uniref:Phage minor head protein n=1 Tax=Roseibium porphyridii TaxID=2866279 RepID=A0ABY8FEK9_9HYPH|nr:phage minor head protein [Roseibium sp. KMA01]WFE92295.1 phage minor head protein [Roseibium sp. KMA01]
MADFTPLPPRAAIAALQTRGLRLDPTFAWQDVYAQDHAAMFTVAKSAGHDILMDIWTALLKALEKGETFETFARRIKPELVRKGWWGEAIEEDPQTGEPAKVRLGSMRRLRTIFDANMNVSYAAGHWSSFEGTRNSRLFLRYVAVQDGLTRPEHQRLHNVVLPIDDPFWNLYAPPNGWNCRCTLQSLSRRDVEQLQREGEDLKFEAPPISYRSWTNKRTGEVRQIPDGIDPGWDYNPGAAGHQATMERLLEREPPEFPET